MRMTYEVSIDSATAFNREGGEDVYGNTYRFEVTVKTEIVKGLAGDGEQIKRALKNAVENYDQNDLAKIFSDPSCLSLAIAVAKKLSSSLETFYSLRVWEGKHRWVELTKEEALAAEEPAPAA